ncbi:hypothetical protein FQA39_LY14876 [Lamprigera yunnana]|nr:hypothetical protein FQA39_LY14876 [Lamprigera yunnana]
MAKLVIAFLAIFAFAGGSVWKDVNTTDVMKCTRELIEVLKTDYNVHHLYIFKDVIDNIRSNLKDRSLDDDNILELDNKLRELSTYLEAPKTMTQRLIDCLEDVAKIFESFTFDLKVKDNSYQHALLKEYRNALKRTCTMLEVALNDFNVKLEVRNAVAEILEDLKTVNFDNAFVRRIFAEHILNFSNEFEMVRDREVLESIDCLKNSVNKKVDTPESPRRDLELCFRKLSTVIEKNDFEHSFEIELLTAIRSLEFNIYIACHTNFQHGETSVGFGLQIQTISTGLINTINSVIIENENAQRILLDTTKEFINELEGLQRKIREESFKIKIDHHVQKLKHALDEIQYNAIQTLVIDGVQEITSEIRYLLRTNFDEALYEICNDFLAILQRQLIQTQNIYQSTTYKQPIEKLARQIQTITNSALVYLRNVPTNDMMIREKLEVQVHHLVKKTRAALNRIGQVSNEEFLKVLDHLKRITVDFENFMDKTKMTSIKEVIFHFNILTQRLAINIKRLAWVSSSSTDLSEIVKNMMSEYLVIIENIQLKIQRINQVAQVGESPKELAVQIEVTSEHLKKLLSVFMSDSLLANHTLMWQVRSFNEILEIIVDQLRFKIINKSAVIYREVAKNLKIIQKSLVTYLDDVKPTNVYKFRSVIGNLIHESAMELQKLTSISQFDIQEGHGLQTTFVRGILMEFLLGLQDFHIQLQHSFQILLSGQSPKKMLIEVGIVSNSVLKLLQEPETDYEPILAIQLGEYVQTIENVLNLLHHRMKGIGAHDSEQEKISDVFRKISLTLQNVDTKDIKKVRENLETAMFKFIASMQELVKMSRNKIEQAQIGTHTKVLHGILSNMLISLRNMYLQLQSAKQIQTYENNRDILNHIAIISNNIMPALETIVGSTTPVKQALDIQVFKYARALKMLINKLDIRTDETVQIKLKEALMVLEQTGSSIATLTINDIKLHLNNLVQGVGVEIQKIDKRDILVYYIMTLKILHVQIQSISRMSHQSENYQLIGMHIDTAVIELSNSLMSVRERYEIVAKIISIESQEMEQVIGNIVSRYQAASILRNNKLFAYIASQLKTIQLSLQDVTVKRATENFHAIVGKVTDDIKRAATFIEQLMWVSDEQTPSGQYRPDIATFIRVTLHDYLTAIQNMVIQIESVVVRVEDDKFDLIRELSIKNNVEQNKFQLTVPMPPKSLEKDYATTSLQNDYTKQFYKYYMTRPMSTDHRNSPVSRRHTIAHTYYKNNIMNSMYKCDTDQHSVQILKDAFEILKLHLDTEENIEKFDINNVLLLVEEIMELASTDIDGKLFVAKLRDAYKNLKRMMIHQNYVNYNQMKSKFLDCIRIVIEAVEEFYTHVHLEGLDVNLLTLLKNWMVDFCIAIKQTCTIL